MDKKVTKNTLLLLAFVSPPVENYLLASIILSASNHTSITASLAPLGAIFGSLVASVPLTHLGRRGTLILTSVLFLAG